MVRVVARGELGVFDASIASVASCCPDPVFLGFDFDYHQRK
jgi:hypothetical protein